MIKLKQQSGVTTYLNYGSSNTLYNPVRPGNYVNRLLNIKLHRHFVDNRRYVAGGGPPGFNVDSINQFMPARMPQGFWTDEYLQLLKDAGVENIWSLQGKFPFQDTIGTPSKVMPINEADYPDQGNPGVWFELGKYAGQVAIRYADDSSAFIDSADVWQHDPNSITNLHPSYLSNTPKAGMGLVQIIQVLNEPNVNPDWIGATNSITAEGTAAAYYAVYTEVRKYSQTIKIVTGPPIGIKNDREFLRRMLDHLKVLFGGKVPSDVYISFHWYMRELNQNQGQGGTDTGASPEFVDAYELGLWVNDLCHEFDIAGWYCTETGWSSSPNIDTSKNAAPIQEGFTQLESHGVLMTRLVLMWSSLDKHMATTFWHCKDAYDSGAYFNGGLLYKDAESTRKPSLRIYEDFISSWGEYDVTGYYPNSLTNEYYATLLGPTGDFITLGWSDKDNSGELTPDPTIVSTVILPDPVPTGSLPPTGSEKPTIEVDFTSLKSITFETETENIRFVISGSVV